MSLAQKLAEFAVGTTRDEIPDDVYDKARCALLHNLSVAAAGRTLAPVAERWSAARPTRESGARALITGRRLTTDDAAFANGCLLHARAQDDVYFPGLTHVGATTIPAALALAEERDASLGDVLEAIVAGYEVAGAISTPTARTTTSYGFRATGIYGVFGAAAATSRLLGLDTDRAAQAIALAASFAAGTNQTWIDGSLEWQFEVGQAARSGLEASLLAQAGGTGALHAFEGASGFFAAFAREASLAGDVVIGREWYMRAVTFKPYPVCAILQSPVVAAVGAAAAHDSPARSATLRLSPPEARYPGTDGRAPFADPGAALMSAAYCLAVALSEQTVRAEDLFRSNESALRELSDAIEVVEDPALGAQSFVLDVTFDDGDTAHIEHIDVGRVFDWHRAELELNVARIAPEFAPGIDADALVEVCFAEASTPVRTVVDRMVAIVG